MFRSLFRSPERMSQALREELHSLCHNRQIQALDRSRHMQRDLGIDCGCDDPRRTELQLPL